MSEKEYDTVLQLKIAMKGIRPPIWRRIQIPVTYTFWDLHIALQDVMGWENSHLHAFSIIDPSSKRNRVVVRIDSGDQGRSEDVLKEEDLLVGDWLILGKNTIIYTYDFGDDWHHMIKLEKVLDRDDSQNYPLCLAGKRATPPEDCGGVWGYYELLERYNNASSEDPNEDEEHEGDDEEFGDWYDEILEDLDPEDFSPDLIFFRDPKKVSKHNEGFFPW